LAHEAQAKRELEKRKQRQAGYNKNNKRRLVGGNTITDIRSTTCFEINNDMQLESMEYTHEADTLYVQITLEEPAEVVEQTCDIYNASYANAGSTEAKQMAKKKAQCEADAAPCADFSSENECPDRCEWSGMCEGDPIILHKVYPEYDAPSVSLSVFEKYWEPCKSTSECRMYNKYNLDSSDARHVSCMKKPASKEAKWKESSKTYCLQPCTKANAASVCYVQSRELEECGMAKTSQEKAACSAYRLDPNHRKTKSCIVQTNFTVGYCDVEVTTDLEKMNIPTEIYLGSNMQHKLRIRKHEYKVDPKIGYVPNTVEYQYAHTNNPFPMQGEGQKFVTAPGNQPSKNVVTFELRFMKRSVVVETESLAYSWEMMLGDGTAIIGFFTGFCVWGGPTLTSAIAGLLGVKHLKRFRLIDNLLHASQFPNVPPGRGRGRNAKRA